MIDLEPDTQTLQKDVINGLSNNPKTLPCKYFYDETGAELFEKICEQEEYYPTRTELAILRENLPDIAARIGPHAVLIEPGSGAGVKTRLLLKALQRPNAYVPLDISREQLKQYSGALSAELPDITIHPVCADFTADLPKPNTLPTGPRTLYFPGSTIGNFQPAAAQQLLARFAALVGSGGKLLIGVDLKKDRSVLEAAYDDKAGITAAFNLNLLARIDRELNAGIDPQTFTHRAEWDEAIGAIRMLLVSDRKQSVQINGNRFDFEQGETICTEHSHKYAIGEFTALANRAGWETSQTWTDTDAMFAIFLFDARRDGII